MKYFFLWAILFLLPLINASWYSLSIDSCDWISVEHKYGNIYLKPPANYSTFIWMDSANYTVKSYACEFDIKIRNDDLIYGLIGMFMAIVILVSICINLTVCLRAFILHKATRIRYLYQTI